MGVIGVIDFNLQTDEVYPQSINTPYIASSE